MPNMIQDFNPYPKSKQLAGHQKDKDTPNFKLQKPRKKRKTKVNKNIEMFHNRKIPHWKKRGEVSRKTANETLRFYGEACAICGNPNYQLHHIMHKGYGIGGRGVWRNLVPLCELHHTGAEGVHTNKIFDQFWKDKHESLFGPHYFKDAWDLWMERHIENPTQELHEKFMKQEENRCQKIAGLSGKNK